jgi:tetratricopeptide (TPR) repeat protein
MNTSELLKRAITTGLSFLLLLPTSLLQGQNKPIPDRVEAFLFSLPAKAKEQISAGKEQIDFSRYVKEWAKETGQTAAQAEAEITRWVSAVEQKADDSYKLGLAAFYQKDFTSAAEKFARTAGEKAALLNELKQKNQATPEVNAKLVSEGANGLRLAGHAFFFNYDFVNAIKSYQQAITFTSREQAPAAWAAMVSDLGQAYSELGLRADKNNAQKLFANAAEAYRKTLEIYTRETFPREWVETQSSLGAALSLAGMRTDGEAGNKLLNEGADILRKALEGVNRSQTPLLWAKIQNNLGTALAELAVRTGGENGMRLLLDAIAAYRLSLEVRTYETYPEVWADTQANLGAAYYFLKDWPQVAECYTNVLKVFPDNQLAHATASDLYQKVLFNFELAFKLNQEWLKRHPNDLLEQVKLVEKYFTTGRFEECQKQIATYSQSKDFSALVQIVMNITHVPTFIALKQPNAVPAKMQTLLETIKSLPESFKIEFETAGMQYYISQNPMFTPYRDWLLKFFKAAGGANRDAVYFAMEEAQKGFQVMANNQ